MDMSAISGASSANLYSLKQALGIATLRKAMNQDAEGVASLLNSMQSSNVKAMENSVTPHKGASIDIKT